MKNRLLLMGIACVCCVSWGALPAALLADEQPSVTLLTSRIEQDFGIKVMYRAVPEGINSAVVFSSAAPEDYEDLSRYLMLLHEELNKYPVCFFQKIRLEAIVLVKRQFYDSKPLEGMYPRNARFIVFDFLRNRGHGIKQRLNVHHELYHMFENQNGLAWRFRDWENLNVPGFSYQIPSTLQPAKNPVNYFAPPVQGFVTYYAMKSPAEDRAEIFATLMIGSQTRVVHRWMEKDAILRDKVHDLQTAVVELCPAMRDKF